MAPATTATTWVLVDVSEAIVEVTVLGGAVTVGPERDPRSVAALQRYTLRRDASGRYQGQLTSLSESDRLAIAKATEINAFLNPSRWTPEIAAQLPQYQLYQDALVAAVLPDPAVQAIDFTLLSRTSQFAGRVQIVGTVTNLGGPFTSRAGQQQVQLYETPLGGRSQLVASQDFQNLAPGETIRVNYQRDWKASSPAEGEFPPSYQVVISYDPDIAIDGNSHNDDSNLQNNRLERSGAGINGLFN
ncbi:hypothetical protein C8255_14255 [filamentous cyanobacterium CCP3]|nr:hypothetical protein C8255_14255 [filamentous cyanobacterium CCP3]